MNTIYIYRRHRGGMDQWGLVKQLYFDFYVSDLDLDGDILVISNQVFYRNEGGAENWGHVHTFSTLDRNYIADVAVSGSTIAINHMKDPFLGEIEVFIYEKDEDGSDAWGEIAASPLLPGTANLHLWMGGAADVALDKVVSADEVAPGDTLAYTLTISNNGPKDAVDVEVKDYLPGNISLESVSGTGWTCGSSDLEVTCTLSSLVAGVSADPIHIEAVVESGSRWIHNLAAVTSYNLELDFDNNQQVEKRLWINAHGF